MTADGYIRDAEVYYSKPTITQTQEIVSEP